MVVFKYRGRWECCSIRHFNSGWLDPDYAENIYDFATLGT